MRSSRLTGVTDVLHREEPVRLGEVDHQPVLRAPIGSELRLPGAGIAQRVGTAVNWPRPDVQPSPFWRAQWVAPVRLMDGAPLPTGALGAEACPHALHAAHGGRHDLVLYPTADEPIEIAALDQARRGS